MCPMQKVSEGDLKSLQKKYGFKFCRIKGTDVVQICKKKSERYEVIDYDEFISVLKKRKLAVHKSSGDFLKIMKSK